MQTVKDNLGSIWVSLGPGRLWSQYRKRNTTIPQTWFLDVFGKACTKSTWFLLASLSSITMTSTELNMLGLDDAQHYTSLCIHMYHTPYHTHIYAYGICWWFQPVSTCLISSQKLDSLHLLQLNPSVNPSQHHSIPRNIPILSSLLFVWVHSVHSISCWFPDKTL